MSQYTIDRAFKLIDSQKFAEAMPLLIDLHDQDPTNARVNYGLGLAYLFFGQPGRAVPHLASAAKAAKKEAAVHTTLASALNLNAQSEEALAPARKGVALDGKSEYTQRVLGQVYADLRKPVMAKQAFERALSAEPKSARSQLGLYEVEKSLGHSETAEDCLHTAFGLSPEDPLVLVSAANSSDETLRENVLTGIERILSTVPEGAAHPEIAKLSFAAGKILDDRQDLEKAFHYFDNYRAGLYRGYQPERYEWFVQTCKTVFTGDFFKSREDFALSSARPVFVVGMPQSGAPLIEKMVSSHPDAAAAGEVPVFLQAIGEFTKGQPHGPALFDHALALDKRTVQRIGRKYLASLDKLDRRSRLMVDATPLSFEYLWLLALLFPNASFVHTTRSAADTCLDLYRTPLPAEHTYNTDQTSLGHYHGQQLDLMDHWQNVLPVKLLEQSFEALVADPKSEGQAPIGHLGLTWHDDCLAPFGKDGREGSVKTSENKLPTPGKWEDYRSQIQPLLKALERSSA
ncbi:tetratricopeptide repeat-containing sulfotransferase family protein [uncultured Roseibium sp.]|uniref:tetratricopeptide repeat-containing sulfotransferase family protein n=1 Tax=uncultured Roseibium sp. TaxID=1936171 RepID=UPI00261FF29B|nr:tetratricopeptide repeat-containing sulfotransferase family protein [uncultured Roseibium sp.]